MTEGQFQAARKVMQTANYLRGAITEWKVKLSKWGMEMQGKRKKNWRGVVMGKSLAGRYDYYVMVKWDHKKKAEWMPKSQIESA